MTLFKITLVTLLLVKNLPLAPSLSLTDLIEANDQCMRENDLCPDDKQEYVYENFPPRKVPEKVLCAIKCANERLGFLQKNGLLDLDKMFAGPPLNDLPRKDSLMSCLRGVGKVVKCRDMVRVVECMKEHDVPKPPGIL